MRKVIAVSALACAFTIGAVGVASADPVGPSGSTWNDGHVTCGTTNNFIESPVVIHNGLRGIEVCADGELDVIQLRVFTKNQDGPPPVFLDYIQLDGDADNPLLQDQLHIDNPLFN